MKPLKIRMCLAWLFLTSCMMPASGLRILSSGYSNQLVTFDFDEETGVAKKINEQEWLENITWMEYDPATGNLYATSEVSSFENFQDTGVVTRWTLAEDGVTWERQQTAASEGTGPAHVLFEGSKNMLYVTNYGGSSLAALPVDPYTGAIKEVVFTDKWENSGSKVVPGRQETSHPHQTVSYKDNFYVVDLGADRIYHYKNQNGNIKRANPYEIVINPGYGPRHMAIDEKNNMAYVLNEIQSVITVFTINPQTGDFTEVKQVRINIKNPSPKGENGAEIQISDNQKHLYVSSRGGGSLTMFDIVSADKGYLTQKQSVKTPDTWPRHFDLTPTNKHLISTDQLRSTIEVYDVDQETGFLTFRGQANAAKGVTVVVFY